MSAKDLTQRMLGRVGLQLVRMPAEGTLERELMRVVADRRIDTVLDIGAHVGLYGQRLRDVGYSGRIVSFEPSPRPFAELQERAGSGWDVHPLALGDESGSATLNVYAEHEELTSLRRPSAYGRDHFGMTLADTVDVPVQRLDDIADELGVDHGRTLVKVDTQGHDLAVMRGGERVLSEAAALQLEIPMFGLYEDAPSGPAMIQQVLELGFDLVGMFPVHEHPRPLVPVEFDALFARGAEAG